MFLPKNKDMLFKRKQKDAKKVEGRLQPNKIRRDPLFERLRDERVWIKEIGEPFVGERLYILDFLREERPLTKEERLLYSVDISPKLESIRMMDGFEKTANILFHDTAVFLFEKVPVVVGALPLLGVKYIGRSLSYFGKCFRIGVLEKVGENVELTYNKVVDNPLTITLLWITGLGEMTFSAIKFLL
jgi:hypothetical protein